MYPALTNLVKKMNPGDVENQVVDALGSIRVALKKGEYAQSGFTFHFIKEMLNVLNNGDDTAND